jgi:opacity protein-like surface antigen
MRTIRWMTSGLALVALLPAIGAAQSVRHFNDSWFWGAKFGVMNFGTTASGTVTAPSVGVDWLITRTHGGLYVSAEQAFFDKSSSVPDNAGNSYAVAIKDMRRFSVAAVAFPGDFTTFHPYAGIGFSMNLIQNADLAEPVLDPQQSTLVESRVIDQKDRVSFQLMGGTQVQYRRISLFGQLSFLPTKSNFLLNDRSAYLVETGVRYNFGKSVERVK